MMQDRGRQLRAHKRVELGWIFLFNNDEKTEKTLAVILDHGGESRAGIAVPRALKPIVAKNKARFGLIISQNPLTHGGLKECLKQNWQNFTVAELLFPIIRHSDVPKHRRMDAAEASSLLATLRIGRHQLPLIHRSDPVCKYFDFREGDIIEILRKNGFQQKIQYFRMVVP